MSYITWEFRYTPYIDEKWNPLTTVVVGNARDPLVRVNLGEAKDSFSFNSTNVFGRNNTLFLPNSKVDIYRAFNTNTIQDSDLIMSGVIKDTPSSISSNQDMTKVEGFNYSEAVASAIVFVDATGKDLVEGLKLALQKAGNNTNFKVVWDPSNRTTKTNGDPFPTITERWFNWTLLKILEKYSQAKDNEDVGYIWYVTNENTLKWFPISQDTGSHTFNYTSDEVIEIKTKKDTKDVKNHIIIKGGRGPDNKAIQESVYDAASVNKHGRKYYFVSNATNNADDIVKNDIGESTDKYPETFPHTTNFRSSITKVVEGVSMVRGQFITGIGTKTQYNEVIREHVKALIRQEADNILTLTKNGKFMVDLTFRAGTKNWVLGDNVSITIPQAQSENKIMRVTEIQYSTNTDTYSLVEDEGTI